MTIETQTALRQISKSEDVTPLNNKFYWILALLLIFSLLVSLDVLAAFDVDAKFNEADTNFRKWFNYGAILALIVSGTLAWKGKINYGWPGSVFGALVLVNSATELVNWFST